MTRFHYRLNHAKILALAAGKKYSEDQLVDIFVEPVDYTTKSHYSLSINIIAEKRANEWGNPPLFRHRGNISLNWWKDIKKKTSDKAIISPHVTPHRYRETIQ
jgi:hypothetical protein